VYATEDAHVIIPRNISHNATRFEEIVSELNSVFKKGFWDKFVSLSKFK